MALFALATFLGAALLFLVQPLLGRFILPWLGGTPAVWTACLLFFQVALLVGYAWAHGVARRRVELHLVVVAISLIFLPITPDTAWQPAPGEDPVWAVLGLLAATVGLPFVVLAATAPLVQARAAAVAAGGPVHRLYAASNAGSLVGLLAFPLLFQPFVGGVRQTHLWSVGYAAFALLLTASLWPTRRVAEQPEVAGQPPAPGDRALWLAFSTAGATLLMAVTEAMSQDLSVTPLLWVLPLACYLLSFIVAFAAEKWTARRVFGPLLVVALATMVLLLHLGYRTHWGVQLVGWCGALFLACVLCHGELVRRRPGPGFLTGFYLWMAAGGALGGIWVGVVAPRLFSLGLELHLALLGTWLLFLVALRRDQRAEPPRASDSAGAEARPLEGQSRPSPGAPRERLRSRATEESPRASDSAGAEARPLEGQSRPSPGAPRKRLRSRATEESLAPTEGRRLLFAVLTLALVGGLALHAWNRSQGAELFRSFFGTLQVKTFVLSSGRSLVHLLDGRISHGFQFQDEARRRQPTAYFAPQSGVGRVLSQPGTHRHLGVVGLGAGTLASYGRPGDRIRLYELNPDVVTVARERFTWLADSAAACTLVEGDARLSLEREPPQAFDVLVLDAFSGDAIPTHLLTREALARYRRHLRGPESLLAINVSNRHANLTRVVRALAAEAELTWRFVRHEEASPLGPYRSDWMILAQSGHVLDFLTEYSRDPPEPLLPPVLWTDDFAPLLPLLKL